MRLISFLSFLLLSQLANAQVTIAGKPFPEQCRLYDSLIENYREDTTLSVDITIYFQPYLNQAIEEDDHDLELMLKIWLNWEEFDRGEIGANAYQSQYETLISKCRKKQKEHLLALAYKAHSYYLMKTGRAAKSIKYTLMAYELYSKMNPSFFIYKKVYMMGLGTAYYSFKDYNKALRYLHEAAAIPTAFEPSLYNTIGLTHYRLKNDDSAMYYFDSAYRYSIKEGREDWQIILTGNLVKPLIRSEQYDSAIAVAKKALQLSQNYWEKVVQCRVLSELAGIYFLKNELNEADKYYTRSIKCHRENDSVWQYNQLPNAVMIFEKLAETKKRIGQYELAYSLLDSAKSLKDSLNRRNSLDRLKNIEFELEQNKLNNTNKALIFEQTETKLQRNLLIALIVAFTLFILFLLSWYSKRKDKLENEKNRATFELKASQDKLATFNNNIQEKNRLLESLQKEISSYKANEQVSVYADTLSELQAATILTDTEWNDFKKNFEKAYPGYISRLNDKYPDLTPAEVRYFVLAKLGMNNKEMASVLGVSTAGVRTIKYRILRKLPISEDDSLEELIENV